MAKRRKKTRSGSSGSWKESNALAAALVVGIIVLWIFLFGSGNAMPDIPDSYWDEAANSLYNSTSNKIQQANPGLTGYPPLINPDTGNATLWEAYTCTNKSHNGEEIIFPYIVKIPKKYKRPDPTEDPGPDADEETKQKYQEMVDNYIMAYDRLAEEGPKCPKCNKREFVVKYESPERKKVIAEIRKQLKNR